MLRESPGCGRPGHPAAPSARPLTRRDPDPARSEGPAVSQQLVLESVLTCPNCGLAARETMPTDACVFFYECGGCRTLLQPRHGDCCVFCSYGSVKCPPIQQGGDCCAPS